MVSVYNKISNFKDILHKCNSLIVLDIDDTIFHYPKLGKKWWINSINYKMLHKKLSFNDADRELFMEWESIIKNHKPIHTDEHGFTELINHCYLLNNDIIFLTARYDRIKEITINHLEQILPNNLHLNLNNNLHFCNGISKGQYLYNLLTTKYKKDYKNIIFIDDMEKNLKSVSQYNPTVINYLFEKNI